MIPAYPKIYALGHPALVDLLDGPVVVQEKVDGSQFSFGVLDGVLACRSRGRKIFLDAPDSMFKAGVDYVKTIEDKLFPGWIYRCEYLRVPNHNTLAYSRIPTHHLVLFDVLTGIETYADQILVESEAVKLVIDSIPYIHYGEMDLEKFQGFMATESYLGGQTVEGVVIKNYDRFCQKTGHVLIGKYVSEDFKEIHQSTWKENNPTRKDFMAMMIGKYKSTARWEKAVFRLRDMGELENEPRDIGKLIKEIWPDIEAECKEEIMEDMWKFFSKDLQRGVIYGFPEWYKQRLMHQQFGEGPNDPDRPDTEGFPGGDERGRDILALHKRRSAEIFPVFEKPEPLAENPCLFNGTSFVHGETCPQKDEKPEPPKINLNSNTAALLKAFGAKGPGLEEKLDDV